MLYLSYERQQEAGQGEEHCSVCAASHSEHTFVETSDGQLRGMRICLRLVTAVARVTDWRLL